MYQAANDTETGDIQDESTQGREDCDIKGNISYQTGEKIYHMPGQGYYDETVINESYGERWFCTEQDALAAGWRKAYK